MPPLGVVEAFDVPEKPDARLLAGGESFAAQQLFLEAGENVSAGDLPPVFVPGLMLVLWCESSSAVILSTSAIAATPLVVSWQEPTSLSAAVAGPIPSPIRHAPTPTHRT
ncbi:MAG: hypothetical protein OXG37_07675 [Actinomycetia bacterium]|nr:hypothetical protein [Actinomycetes bacterium]